MPSTRPRRAAAETTVLSALTPSREPTSRVIRCGPDAPSRPMPTTCAGSTVAPSVVGASRSAVRSAWSCACCWACRAMSAYRSRSARAAARSESRCGASSRSSGPSAPPERPRIRSTPGRPTSPAPTTSRVATTATVRSRRRALLAGPRPDGMVTVEWCRRGRVAGSRTPRRSDPHLARPRARDPRQP